MFPKEFVMSKASNNLGVKTKAIREDDGQMGGDVSENNE